MDKLNMDFLMTNLLNGKATLQYNPVSDILLVMFVPLTVETVVHYINDYVGLLYKPDTMEVVGLQIEAIFKQIKLEDLLQEIEDNNIHGEITWGDSVGNEEW